MAFSHAATNAAFLVLLVTPQYLESVDCCVELEVALHRLLDQLLADRELAAVRLAQRHAVANVEEDDG